MGLTISKCAAKHGCSTRTINTIKRSLNDSPVKPAVSDSFADWKAEFRESSKKAVLSGLRTDDDPYKRAGIGIQVLKGLGDLLPDQSSSIPIWMLEMPTVMQERYIGSGSTDQLAIDTATSSDSDTDKASDSTK